MLLWTFLPTLSSFVADITAEIVNEKMAYSAQQPLLLPSSWPGSCLWSCDHSHLELCQFLSNCKDQIERPSSMAHMLQPKAGTLFCKTSSGIHWKCPWVSLSPGPLVPLPHGRFSACSFRIQLNHMVCCRCHAIHQQPGSSGQNGPKCGPLYGGSQMRGPRP